MLQFEEVLVWCSRESEKEREGGEREHLQERRLIRQAGRESAPAREGGREGESETDRDRENTSKSVVSAGRAH